MNATRLHAMLLAVLAPVGFSAFGQAKFALTFTGTCFQTNAAGKIVSQAISDKTILQEVAQHAGITDVKTLGLVYHENGNAFGDTIDVINPTNGTVLDTLFGFYFGEAFDRMVLTNRNGAERRLDYVYTKQNDHSLGSALINKSAVSNRPGSARQIDGQMKWVVTLDAENPAVKICAGKFKTGKLLSFTNAP
jgi:hypothetical protein